jgi:hypothetical protein
MQTSRFLLAAALTTMAVPLPVEIVPDSGGRIHISLAVGRASYEAKEFDCSGNILQTGKVDISSAGGRLDLDVGHTTRITVHGGTLSWQDPLDCEVSYDGPVLGAQLAHEGERFGIGAGLVRFTRRDDGVSPSIYLRFGRLAETACRLEFMPPEPAFGSVGWLRLGLVHEMARARRTGWLAGLSVAPYTYPDAFEPRAFADVRLPIVGGLDLLAGAQIGPGHDQAQWSVTTGLRWTP